MQPRIILTLPEKEYQALLNLAEKEFRDPRMQAALILRMGLETQGVLSPMKPITGSEPPAQAVPQATARPREKRGAKKAMPHEWRKAN